jgi:3-oxoacyl-[acyl-carrier protein] reductase
MGRFGGKVALVTGGSRGIGRSIALRLASEGAAVAVNYRSDRDGAESVVHHITVHGGRAVALPCDVAVADEVATLVNTTVQELGSIQILVNNAGVTADTLTVRLSEEDWDRVLDTDLKGAFLATKAVLRPMMRQRWGRVINIASVVAYTGNAGQASYAAAKAGLVGLTKSVAREVATRGITANVVAPGLIQTTLTDALAPEVRKWMIDQIPMDRPGLPEDVAASVAFLASDDAAYITGQVLKVDGGMVML